MPAPRRPRQSLPESAGIGAFGVLRHVRRMRFQESRATTSAAEFESNRGRGVHGADRAVQTAMRGWKKLHHHESFRRWVQRRLDSPVFHQSQFLGLRRSVEATSFRGHHADQFVFLRESVRLAISEGDGRRNDGECAQGRRFAERR